MKYCLNCGNACEENMLYCTNCGSKLPDTSVPQTPVSEPDLGAQTAATPEVNSPEVGAGAKANAPEAGAPEVGAAAAGTPEASKPAVSIEGSQPLKTEFTPATPEIDKQPRPGSGVHMEPPAAPQGQPNGYQQVPPQNGNGWNNAPQGGWHSVGSAPQNGYGQQPPYNQAPSHQAPPQNGWQGSNPNGYQNNPYTPQNPNNYQPQPQENKVMGILSLIFGIASLVFFWVPFLPLLLAVAAGVLGIIHLNKCKSKGFGIAGLITGVVGLLIAIFMTIVWFIAFDEVTENDYHSYPYGYFDDYDDYYDDFDDWSGKVIYAQRAE